jgi:hypothetical protein
MDFDTVVRLPQSIVKGGSNAREEMQRLRKHDIAWQAKGNAWHQVLYKMCGQTRQNSPRRSSNHRKELNKREKRIRATRLIFGGLASLTQKIAVAQSLSGTHDHEQHNHRHWRRGSALHHLVGELR